MKLETLKESLGGVLWEFGFRMYVAGYYDAHVE